jgi:hypothetical protein
MAKNTYGESITIEIVAGGFILSYPVKSDAASDSYDNMQREVFASPRKLNKKIQEVIKDIGLVADEAE